MNTPPDAITLPPPKLRGGPLTEMTRWKHLWRDQLTEDQQDAFLALFQEPGLTRAAIRQRLLELHGIDLRHDSQLNRFLDWESRQRARAELAERLTEDPPGDTATNEQIFTTLLGDMYAESLHQRDVDKWTRVARVHMRCRAIQLQRDRFEKAQQTKLDAGFTELARYVKGDPAIRAAYEQLRTLVHAAEEENQPIHRRA